MYGRQEDPSSHPQQPTDKEQHGYDYAPPDGPPPIDWSTKPEGGENFDDRFKVEKPKFNDWPFTIIFLAVVGGFIAIAAITISSYIKSKPSLGGSIYSGNDKFALNTNTLILFSFATAVAVVLSAVYFLMARAFTRVFIIVTTIISLIMGYATAIYYFSQKYYSAGAVFLFFALFNTWAFWTMRGRIPFATLVLKTIIDVMRVVPSVLFISLIGAIVAGAFSVLFSITLVSIYVKYAPGDGECTNDGTCSQGKLVGLIVFGTFAGYYISEVLKNVIHTTICGVYGSWYYCSKSDQGMPKWPAMGSFKRSMTYSFGSICFGSLIVAFINLIRSLLEVARRAAQQNGDVLGQMVICCIQCMFWLIDWLITYFNHYAYTYIALYGKAYLPAAKDTWTMIKSKGFDALINDSLIGNVLNIGSLLIAYTCALLAYLYLRYTQPAYNSSGGFYPVIVAYAFLMGMQISSITNVAIRSGVATFFVALATDPEVFQQSYPDKFADLLRVYPEVQQKLGIQL